MLQQKHQLLLLLLLLLTATTTKAPTPTTSLASSSSSSSHSAGSRTPSIKFLGKNGWAHKLSEGEGGATNVVYIPANYGRLSFSEEEMEALIMGGANIAPKF